MEWKSIPGFPLYEVSIRGEVRNAQTGKILHQGRTDRGYPRVHLRKDGRTWCKATHRMVMQSFVGPRPEGMEVAHLDGDKENNNLLNLQYCTPEENRRHNVINGVSWAGEKHPLRKLSNEAVKEIRERLGRGDGAYRELMHKYGVSKSAIYKAYEGVSWRPE